jgi:ubiquinone/menaquinone biosynthesis C-methylase UbiE
VIDPTNHTYVLEQQYRNSSNLTDRIQIHQRFSTNPRSWPQWFFGLFEASADASILEIGCGNGTLWREGTEWIEPGWSITLADVSPGMLEDARSNLCDVPHAFEYRVADIQGLPFSDASFDAVIANFMLYHVADRDKSYREVIRVMRPGGRFYAATIGVGHMRQLEEAVCHIDSRAATNTPLSFSIDASAGELRKHFQHVQIHRRKDSLEVTDAEAIVRYAQSGRRKLNAEGDAELRRYVQAEIGARGAFHVEKAMGMFVCWNPA